VIPTSISNKFTNKLQLLGTLGHSVKGPYLVRQSDVSVASVGAFVLLDHTVTHLSVVYLFLCFKVLRSSIQLQKAFEFTPRS